MPLYLTQYPAYLKVDEFDVIYAGNEGNISIPGYTYGMITAIEVNTPCRLRLYINSAYRDADVSRLLGDPRPENHGILFEGNFSINNLVLPVLPIASGKFSEMAYRASAPGVFGKMTTIRIVQ